MNRLRIDRGVSPTPRAHSAIGSDRPLDRSACAVLGLIVPRVGLVARDEAPVNGFQLGEAWGNWIGAGPGGNQALIHPVQQLQSDRVEPGIAAQVCRLVRIALKVVESLIGARQRASRFEVIFPLAAAAADDQLEPLGPDHGLLAFVVLAEDHVMALCPGLPSIKALRSMPCNLCGRGT